MEIKDYVYNYRKEHALSMQAFGKKCGLSRAYISILEKGFNPATGKPFVPGLATLKRIADCTGADIENLIKMRMDTKGPLNHQTLNIKLSSSSGLKETDAVKIDMILKSLKMVGNTTVSSEVQNEAKSILEYEINF